MLCITNQLTDQWMLVVSTQMIGFSMGGILRPFLVNPPSMSASLSNIFTCVHNPSISLA